MLPLHPEPTDPDLLIADVARSFRPAAEAASVAIATEIPDDLPIVEVDPVRIREVLANLVANGLRHTPAGGRVTIAGRGRRARAGPERRRHRPGHRSRRCVPHVFDRFVKGTRLARLRAGPRDRPGPRGGPRRDDLGRLAGRWRDDVPGRRCRSSALTAA